MKEKTNFKGFLGAILIAITVFSFSITAFASENTDFNKESGEYTAVYAGNPEDAAQITEEITDNVGNGKSGIENFFAVIYAEMSKYATEIISAITLVGTVILGFAYKRGLLPLVTHSISAIQQSVTKIKSDTESGIATTQSGLDSVTERLGELENSVTIFKDTLDTLEEQLQCEAEYVKERKKMNTVMLSQIDMLYDIFMASALPQYQKDAVGTKVQMMKEELELYDKIAEK